MKAEGEEGVQSMRWLDGITDAMEMDLGKLWEMVRDREGWHTPAHGVAKSDMTGRLHHNNNRNKTGKPKKLWK